MKQKTTSEQEQTSNQNAHEMLQEERYLWMARAFVVMLVLAVICDFVMLIALSNVTPVMRVQPFYIETQNKNDQIISVLRPSTETLNSDAIKISLVRQYLMARYGIGSDLNELKERWGDNGPVFWMSEPSVYNEFQEKEKVPYLPLVEQKNFLRGVTIENVNKIPQRTGSSTERWRAVLRFEEKDQTTVKPRILKLNAELIVGFRPIRGMTWQNRLKNPLGFVVRGFGITPVEEKSEK